MSFNKNERRKDIRYDFPKRIEYGLSPKISDEIFYGVTINISNSGLCLYIFNLIPEGQKIAIKSTLPIPHQTATLRWIKKVDADFYKAGVMFTDNSKNLS